MDTLTNVVAILVFILIMVQINASRSVKKILSDLPQVTEEQLKAKMEEVAKRKPEIEKRQEQLKSVDPKKVQQDIRSTQDELLALEKTQQKKQAELVSKSALEKEWRVKAEELEKSKSEAEELLKKRQALLASLQEVGQQKPAGPKEVRIPNSRPVPPSAKKVYILLSGNEVFTFDEEEAQKQAAQLIKGSLNALRPEKVERAGKQVPIYDQNKLHELFETRKPFTRDCDLTLPLNPPYTRMALKLTPRANMAEPAERVTKMNSRFQTTLRQLRNTANGVAWFLVMPNAVENYLNARQVVDQAGVPAGWQMVGEAAHRITLEGVEVKNLVEPPPANPDAIPGPKAGLD